MNGTLQPPRVILAMDNAGLRARFAQALADAGCEVVELSSSREITRVSRLRDVIVLETQDDVDLLIELVHELYSTANSRQTLPIVAVLSPEVGLKHPGVAYWNIDGHAALSATVQSGRPDTEQTLVMICKRVLDGLAAQQGEPQ